ncbi:MAG: tetratricopeptide repeat protein [Muribaculaceae bacterium]|nr:tetratricopeptide repeat protein [Muribaculaceae bacterium]
MKITISNILKAGGKIICPLLFFIPSLYAFSSEIPSAQQASDHEEKYEALIDSADRYAAIKNWTKAELFTLEAIRLQPAKKTNWLLWANLGEIRTNLERDDDAIEAYNIALTLHPKSQKTLMGRARLLILNKRVKEALPDLTTLLTNDSTLEWPRIMRGFILLDKGLTKEAAVDFSILNRLYPDNNRGYYGLGMAAQMEGRNDKAIEMFSKTIEIEPEEEAYLRLISLLADEGKLMEASDRLREAMKQFPRNGNMFLLRAYLHKLNFQNDEAEIALKLANEYHADPHLFEIFFPKITKQERKK